MARDGATGEEDNATQHGGSTAILTAERLSRSFGAVEVLREITLSFYGGQAHAIVGENGAGKSR